MSEQPMTAQDLCKRIKVRFAAPEYATIFEVRNTVGYAAKQIRYADAIACSLYPSRGLNIHGIEVKVSRGDWVKEMREPNKAEAIAKYCNFWWLCVPDESIVLPGELPQNWGLLVPCKSQLALRAKKQPAALTPLPLDKKFVFSLLRSILDGCVLKSSMESEIAERVKSAHSYELDSARRGEQYARDASDKIMAKVTEFQKVTGLSLDIGNTWSADRNYKDIAVAVKLYQRHGSNLLQWFKGAAEHTEYVAAEIRKVLQELESPISPADPTKQTEGVSG